MAEKDITQKTLESYNDVFADIVNVLLFNGRDTVKEEDLTPDVTSSYYKAEGKVQSQDRDVSKFWKNNNIRIALFGIENQTKAEKLMPIRIMGYDGASYRNQLTNKNNQKEIYPVVTMVLFFGTKGWNYSHSLIDCLTIPEDLKPFVSDYKINVFEIASLTDEQVNMFKSDFKIVADYFVQLKRTGTYKPMNDRIKHVWEMLNLMSVLTEDSKFEETYQSVRERECVSMCEVVEHFIQEGKAEGLAEGLVQGIKQMVVNMYKAGIAVKTIAQVAETTEEEVLAIVKPSI